MGKRYTRYFRQWECIRLDEFQSIKSDLRLYLLQEYIAHPLRKGKEKKKSISISATRNNNDTAKYMFNFEGSHKRKTLSII